VIIVATLLFCVYFLLGYFKDRNWKILFAILFLILSYLLKFSIDVTKTADYENYLYLITLDLPEFSLKMLFAEPYFFQLGSWLIKYYSKEQSLAFFTESSFIYSTIFFLWLAFLKDVSTFNRIIIFSLYYYFFAYIVFRNGPAYMLSGVSFYYLHKNIYIKTTVLLFLMHLSSLPVIFFSMFKNKLGDRKLIFICFLFIIFFNILVRIELFALYDKFSFYANEAEYGQSIFHKIYFYSFVLFNICLIYFKKDVIYNYTYLLLFVTYLILNYSNSVMGYRFSIYLTLYLMLNPKLDYSDENRPRLLYLIPIFFAIFIFNYLTLQK